MRSPYQLRQLKNRLLGLCAWGAMLLCLIFLSWILFTLIAKGLGGLSLAVFTQNTPPPGSAGGLLNAIIGSLIMVGLAVLIGAPIGLMAGIFLAEYSRESMFAQSLRFMNDILLSAPSIIIGLFVYTLVVAPMKHFSGLAGSLALAVIIIPVVLRATDDMLRLVPNSLREAAFALGASKARMIRLVSLKAAKTGILTGLLLAIARITGETAPLLFTALNNQFLSFNLNAPLANLPGVVFQFAMSPYEDWQKLGWAGALLITTFVLTLNIVIRTRLK